MWKRVLIANRGAIATRITRTLRRMGVLPIAVYSDADRHAPHLALAEQSVRLRGVKAAESYLDIDQILAAAKHTGADALHPGYGFLSENADFAERCAAAGVCFIGPTPEQMRAFGLKHVARALAVESGLPLLPGTGLLSSVADALAEADRIGYPVMLKSTAGGGGIGMRRCADADELISAFDATERLARANFKESGLYLEKLVSVARHLEVQVFGDGRGEVLALGERDCSLQRRHQKVVEETPALNLDPARREQLLGGAVRLAKRAQYRSAGTVEFVCDAITSDFYFLEVNTRIQVEHGVTEEVTGVDLIEWMVRLSAGELGDLAALAVTPRGASVEARLYAEDPQRAFQPSAGLLQDVAFPADVRVETWIDTGTEVTPYYDPMLAKLIARGATRDEAIARLIDALERTRVAGIETNRDYLLQVLASQDFRTGAFHTRTLETFPYAAATFEVVEAGTQTTVQDHPGRLGYWSVGVPPSGPMDAVSFRWANRLVGNDPRAAGLECTLVGPTLRFHTATTIALTGADMGARLDGEPLERHRPIAVEPGSELQLGAVRGPGARAYLALRRGIAVPEYLGSRSTFTLGLFGGHGGRALRTGDVLHIATDDALVSAAPSTTPLPSAFVPELVSEWQIAVLHGPHGAPDFFTPEDITALFATSWKVHYNSSRTGVRLLGPRPTWARRDGGEAGLHPSNIHDTAYAVGTLDFTGDMPVILGPDGPSLGGFVCPVSIVQSELWKVGQLKAGDTVRFFAVELEDARARLRAQDRDIASGSLERSPGTTTTPTTPTTPTTTTTTTVSGNRAPLGDAALLVRAGEMAIRQDGDANVLVEYGPMVLDLALRFRVQALMDWLARQHLDGIIDLTPGIRSLQVHYDDRRLPREKLLAALVQGDAELPSTDAIEVPSRIVHLPLSWEDPATLVAIRKYMQSVRADAPWCPSNIEFIRRINGLASVDEVRAIVFSASYLVLGLGDVYLGAPVATPIDPRHRLVTTKYNPARTWTPENAVGIGGAYLCVYGMEGPGGYQFVGRTCQMWNRYRAATGGQHWLLRFFDQIRFYPVTAAELLEFREAFPRGQAEVTIESTTFRLRDYQAFLREQAPSIAAFKSRQQEAFEAERDRWALLPRVHEEPSLEPDSRVTELVIPEGALAVRAQVAGSVWQVLVAEGQTVQRGDKLVVLETMKMETLVVAPRAGVVGAVLCREGTLAHAGMPLLVLN